MVRSRPPPGLGLWAPTRVYKDYYKGYYSDIISGSCKGLLKGVYKGYSRVLWYRGLNIYLILFREFRIITIVKWESKPYSNY